MAEIVIRSLFAFDMYESKLLRSALNPFEVLVRQYPEKAQDEAYAEYQRIYNSVSQNNEMDYRRLLPLANSLMFLRDALIEDGKLWKQRALDAPEGSTFFCTSEKEAYGVLSDSRQTQAETCNEALAVVYRVMNTLGPLDGLCQQLKHVVESDEGGEE